jgi:hypothetical protein
MTQLLELETRLLKVETGVPAMELSVCVELSACLSTLTNDWIAAIYMRIAG